ncbi:thiamine phosphate synthase [Candidatus Pelagibacter bacterium nBUS_44]|uniref:thiamine phosphate synthase n=1 Tax=Candidatus Pelagibacter bacterium nBUS_44 TaxID=3374195 RepID=UPI003EC0171F
MRTNKKKFIYLISPNYIYPRFYWDLKKVLSSGKVSFFQMRFKKYSYEKKIIIGKKIKQICKNSNVKFLVNDSPELSKKLGADGCHLGQKDMNIIEARKIIGNKIIGITCHNSINLAKAAIKGKANYIAFGAFFSTKTKKVKYQATTKILDKVKKLTRIPLVAIGGINLSNYTKLLLNNANLLAISSYVWNNKKYKPFEAIEKIK